MNEIIKVINSYSNALNLLDNYDHRIITKPKGTISNKKVSYKNCINIINKLKINNNSNLFALERNEGPKEKEILIDLIMNFLTNNN